jgi:hypothetical protein
MKKILLAAVLMLAGFVASPPMAHANCIFVGYACRSYCGQCGSYEDYVAVYACSNKLTFLCVGCCF